MFSLLFSTNFSVQWMDILQTFAQAVIQDAPFLNPFFSLLSAQNVALMPSCDDHFASMRRDEANGRRGKAGGTQRTNLWPFQRDSQLRQPPATLLQTSYHFRAAAPNCSACCETSFLFSFKSILTKLPFFN